MLLGGACGARTWRSMAGRPKLRSTAFRSIACSSESTGSTSQRGITTHFEGEAVLNRKMARVAQADHRGHRQQQVRPHLSPPHHGHRRRRRPDHRRRCAGREPRTGAQARLRSPYRLRRGRDARPFRRFRAPPSQQADEVAERGLPAATKARSIVAHASAAGLQDRDLRRTAQPGQHGLGAQLPANVEQIVREKLHIDGTSREPGTKVDRGVAGQPILRERGSVKARGAIGHVPDRRADRRMKPVGCGAIVEIEGCGEMGGVGQSPATPSWSAPHRGSTPS